MSSCSDLASLHDIEPWSLNCSNNTCTSNTLYSVNNELNSKISLLECDITKLNIDCIVNAATENLEGGGGIDYAIHKAAGSRLLDACLKLPINKRTNNRCETGDSKITPGFDLPAKYVMHTVGPRDRNANKLKSCYESSFENVLTDNIKSIAFCCIATGIFKFPKRKAAEIALSTARQWLEVNHGSVYRVIFCFYGDTKSKQNKSKQVSDFDIYKELMPVYFPNDKSNIGSTDTTYIDDNLPIVTEDTENGNNENTDDEMSDVTPMNIDTNDFHGHESNPIEIDGATCIASNTQSGNMISPEMMNKHALLKELEKQKEKVSKAEKYNLSKVKSPVKKKRKHLTSTTRSKKYRANLSDTKQSEIQAKNTTYQQSKRQKLPDDIKSKIQAQDTKQHQTKHKKSGSIGFLRLWSPDFMQNQGEQMRQF